MEVMLVNSPFKTEFRNFNQGEVYLSTPKIKDKFTKEFKEFALKYKKPNICNTVKFLDIDRVIKKATKDSKFNNLLIIRSGGIGDLIALTSIMDYFQEANVHFVTQRKYFDLFDWFTYKPKLYDVAEAFIKDFNLSKTITKYSNWARFQAEGVIENGHGRNWFELFFSFINEINPDKELLRPQLRTERISNAESNIQASSTGQKSILVCNKASAMMRTCHASDIVNALPGKVLLDYDIFIYGDNLSPDDFNKLRKVQGNIIIIEKTDLKTFFLDCFDADMVISVDTGALHFREGINKPAIGLYNSFSTESRTKHYQFTKSFDIKWDCKLMPCFLHETPQTRYCKFGKQGMFAAPCFDSAHNNTLKAQLTKIFDDNL